MRFLLTKGLLMLAMLLSTAVVAAGAGQKNPAPSIGLALGSGGAAGLAHIAMLQVFDDLGIKPAKITGASIGAVIGGLYAAGQSAEEIRKIFDEFGGSNLDMLSHLVLSDSELKLGDLLKLDINNGGLIDSGGFLKFLAGKIDARTFDDLDIPLEVVATDYWSGETVVLKQGDLFQAIEASMAVPGLFSPVQLGEQLLVDGGTTNPLPFDLLNGAYDLVVAIDVTGSRSPGEEQQLNWTEALFSTFEIMQQSLIASRIRLQKPDIYIKPEVGDIRLLHFNRIAATLERSAPAAQELKQQLRDFLKDQ
jgi:NTE family protein